MALIGDGAVRLLPRIVCSQRSDAAPADFLAQLLSFVSNNSSSQRISARAA